MTANREVPTVLLATLDCQELAALLDGAKAAAGAAAAAAPADPTEAAVDDLPGVTFLAAVFPKAPPPTSRGKRKPAGARMAPAAPDPAGLRAGQTLLLTGPEEYAVLEAARVTSRGEGLKALGRAAAEQQEWEARALEAALLALGRPTDASAPAGALHELLLRFRAESPVNRGMLFHLRTAAEAEEALLTGEFANWGEHDESGAIALRRIAPRHWAVVVGESVLPPRELPHRFAFVVRQGPARKRANGLYQVAAADPLSPSTLTLTGKECYFDRHAAAARLAATAPPAGRREPEPLPQAATAPDFGRVRWLGVTAEQAAADMQRVRWAAQHRHVSESLARVAEAADDSGKGDAELAAVARDFLANRASAPPGRRTVYVSELPHLFGYPIHEDASVCLTEDVLHEPRELDLTLCRQLYALLDPERAGAENEQKAERLLSPAIVHVAMEMIPYARRGGVADVVHGLPGALEKLGQSVAVFIPYYANMSDDLLGIEPLGVHVEALGEWVELLRSTHHGVDVYLLKHPRFGERSYDGDELATAVLFCRAVLAAVAKLRMKPDVIHCHDWQAGLLPGCVCDMGDSPLANVPVLFTVHNLGYRGSFPNDRYWVTGLSPERHRDYRDGDYGFSLLIGGILSAGPGRVNTVSPNYAREITQTELGWGLQPILRRVGVFGLLNGIDYQVYNPETDPHIRRTYDFSTALDARAENKADLQRVRVAVLGDDNVASHMPEILPGCTLREDPDAFVIGMIARIAEQKGLEVMVGALRLLLDQGHDVQFLFNGQPATPGDVYCRDIIRLLFPLVNAYPNRILLRFSHEFDHGLGQRMYAGCDVLVSTPSYEPCGLEPMKCSRYGCVPVVRATGGLVDQVTEFDPTKSPEGNGFVFQEFDPAHLAGALERAMRLYRGQPAEWQRLVQRCMRIDFSWEKSARRYLNWYYRVSRE